MASYAIKGSDSIVQVLTPTVSEDMVSVTILTSPTGIAATTLVSQTSFDDNKAAETLTAFADNIEQLIALGKAIGGTGSQTLDANGLLSYFVTFTVAYNAAGVPVNQVTVDVDVPVNLLTQTDPAINEVVFGEAEAKIDTAYNSLVSMAGG